MARILEQAGHPAPLFRIDHDCLVVEIRPATDRGNESSSETAVKKERNGVEQSTRDVILEEVRSSGRITTRICVQRLGIPRTTAKRFLTDLVKEGLLIIEGSGSMTSYRPSGPMVGQ
jgi:predicted HTH transcriptional regulator